MGTDHPRVLTPLEGVECKEQMFEPHKDVIERYYLKEKMRLSKLRILMKSKCHLDQTSKQWKTMLQKWGFKRNLSLTDAAHCQRLLDRQKAWGLPEVVIFSKQPKTREDINNYINRKKGIADSAALSAKITSTDPTPFYITLPVPHPELPQTPPPSGGLSALSGSPVSTANISPTDSSETSRGVSPYLPGPSTSKFLQIPSTFQLHAENGRGQQMTDASFVAKLPPYFGSSHEDDLQSISRLVDPFRQKAEYSNAGSSFQKHNGCFDSLSKVLSATPTPLSDPISLSELVKHEGIGFDETALGNYRKCPQVSDEFRPASLFVAHCIFWCICASQKNHKYVEHAEYHHGTAMVNYTVMLRDNKPPGEECLSAITILNAILDSVGQSERLTKLLNDCNHFAKQAFGPDNPLSKTLAFGISVQQNRSRHSRTGVPKYNLVELERIVQQIKREYPSSQGPALTAEYYLAWARLELGQHVLAQESLNDIFARCRLEFGENHLQTIMAAATQVRAAMVISDFETANRILQQEVHGRIIANFPKSHPYMWEANHRQAYLLHMMAKKMEDEKKHHNLMVAEALLRDIVVNRYRVLGPCNPKSKETSKLLKQVLKSQDKKRDADMLDSWIEIKLGERAMLLTSN